MRTEGINLNELAKVKGLEPRMGLREAKEKGDWLTECPVCHQSYQGELAATMVHCYGQCSPCLKEA